MNCRAVPWCKKRKKTRKVLALKNGSKANVLCLPEKQKQCVASGIIEEKKERMEKRSKKGKKEKKKGTKQTKDFRKLLRGNYKRADVENEFFYFPASRADCAPAPPAASGNCLLPDFPRNIIREEVRERFNERRSLARPGID